MNKELEEIKDIVKYLYSVDYKMLVKALIIYDTIDYVHDLEDLIKEDLNDLEDMYQFYRKSDINILNVQELIETYDFCKEVE